MDGLMMDYQLNVPAILRRGEELFGDREIVSRLPDKSWHRYTYADFTRRTKQLALALRNELGLVDGDRVATFAWNHHEHLETYIGAPGRRVRHAHPEPAAPSRRPHVHRDPRRRPRPDRRQDAVAARRGVQGPRRLRARDRDRSRADARRARSTSRSCSRRRTPTTGRTGTSTSAQRRPCVTRAARRVSRRASSTRIARSRIHRSDARSSLLGLTCDDVRAARRADVPRERVVLPVLVAFSSASSTSTPARTSTRSRCSTPSRARR